jgi:hypothetical protein
MMKSTWNARSMGLLTLMIVVTTLGWHRSRAEQQPASIPIPPLGPNGLGLTYTPMPNTFKFQPKQVVNTWVETNDTKAMIEHAWELWGGLSTMVTQQVDGHAVHYPTFETWVDEFTVFPQPSPFAAAAALASPQASAPRPQAHPFTRPKQLRRRGERFRLADEAAPKPTQPTPRVVTVKYTKEIYDNVFAHQYNQTAVMLALNESWSKTTPPTPLADQKVQDFDDKSIMIKPVYQIVSGTEGSLVNYWAGPAASTNPSAPGINTWTNKMLVVPPGVPHVTIQGVPVVPVDQFYNFKLNKQEAVYINSMNQGRFKEGDYAILVAMHVSSREIDNWTWETFWWSIDKPKIPDSVRGRVHAPFDHYDVAVGYSFTTGPDSEAGLNVLCFNPYLEADFDNSTFAKPGQLGIESNCMSCHRAATWPPPSLPNNAAYFTANGILKADDPYFQGTTKVDFIWGFADDVTPPPPPSSPIP